MEPECNVAAEMPKYRCHKEVHALKIKSVDVTLDNGITSIMPDDEGYASFYVSQDYVDKHKPVAGGYYVVYKDGYKSFSPAEAFEDGYELVQ